MTEKIIITQKLSQKDWIDINRKVKSTKKNFKKKKIASYLFLFLFFVEGTYFIYQFYKFFDIKYLIFGLFFYFFIFLIHLSDKLEIIFLLRFLKNSKNEIYFTEVKYIFSDECIESYGVMSNGKFYWNGIVKVIFTDSYCFLYISLKQGIFLNLKNLDSDIIINLKNLIEKKVDVQLIENF